MPACYLLLRMLFILHDAQKLQGSSEAALGIAYRLLFKLQYVLTCMLSSMRVLTRHSLKRSSVQQANTTSPNLRKLRTVVSTSFSILMAFIMKSTAGVTGSDTCIALYCSVCSQQHKVSVGQTPLKHELSCRTLLQLHSVADEVGS